MPLQVTYTVPSPLSNPSHLLSISPDLSLSCYVPGLLVTSSTDDTIKFWDIQVIAQGSAANPVYKLHFLITKEDKPVFLLSRDMHMVG